MKYCIGVDFGTLSARAILVNMNNGETIAESEFVYPHKVMVNALPCGKSIDKDSAYQHPQDYIDGLGITVKEVICKSNVNVNDIKGIGIDFTSCTCLPVDENNTPMCFKKEYTSEPHAYVKLWKHNSAQSEADLITNLAKKHNCKWLDSYGGKVSSQWIFPKILETLNKAPKLYHDTARFTEAADWLVHLITGNEVHSSCMAGYKAMWNKRSGYPDTSFLAEIATEFKTITGTKISENILPAGTKAGTLNEYGAALTGLNTETIVSVPIIDAHASLPAAGIVGDKKLMIIIGTSSCHIIMDKENKTVDGICGSVEDGIIPGFTAYEAGQSCVGDTFDWFVNNTVPYEYFKDAQENNRDIFSYLNEKAANLKVGENHLVALDWFNGNRTPYSDSDLTGVITGLNIQTKPEEVYRAIIEATAFGTKAILDLYKNNGIEADEIYATGGISQKNEFLMQIYADVLGKEIIVPDIPQAGAKGSAVLAACACGYYQTFEDAANAMCNYSKRIYSPVRRNTEIYKELYSLYLELSEFYGNTHNHIMKKLNKINKGFASLS